MDRHYWRYTNEEAGKRWVENNFGAFSSLNSGQSNSKARQQCTRNAACTR